MSQSLEDKIRLYLEQIGYEYSLNESSGLFEPPQSSAKGQPPTPAQETQQRIDLGRDCHTPFHVNVLRDWLAMAIPATQSALTLLLLVATVVYTRRQWLEANRSANASEIAANAAKSAAETANSTLKEMKTGQGARDTHTLAGQAVTQATQTTNLATATSTLAQTSKDALISVQRAFVFPSPSFLPVFKPNTTELSSIEVQPTWSNAGATPTKNMEVHGSEVLLQVELPESFNFPDLWDAGLPHVPTPSFVAPKGTFGAHSISVPLAAVEAVADKKLHLYLYGPRWSP
jgi:hypothetical protein